MSKKLELLKKIQELAKRGVDGEAVNAQELLSDLLIKYNLTLDDLESSDIADRYMKVNKDDVKILYQIVKNVICLQQNASMRVNLTENRWNIWIPFYYPRMNLLMLLWMARFSIVWDW